MTSDNELEKALNNLSQIAREETARHQKEMDNIVQMTKELEIERQVQKQLSNVNDNLSLGLSILHFPVVVCLYDKDGQHIRTFDTIERVNVNDIRAVLSYSDFDNLAQVFPNGKWSDKSPIIKRDFGKTLIQAIYHDDTILGSRIFQWTIIEYLLFVGDVFETDKVKPQSILNKVKRGHKKHTHE